LSYARALRAFPWHLDTLLVLFTRDTHEPGVIVRLVAYTERTDASAATGYATVELLETQAVDGVVGDLERL